MGWWLAGLTVGKHNCRDAKKEKKRERDFYEWAIVYFWTQPTEKKEICAYVFIKEIYKEKRDVFSLKNWELCVRRKNGKEKENI